MRKGSRSALAFACCVLAIPTCVQLLDGFQSDSLAASVAMGALLGTAHVAVRPILRILSLPIGCFTMGLVSPLIDIGLLYACAHFVEGFAITNFFHAILAVALINAIRFIGIGRR
jgi:putative membrane protein